ncbi:uncharacterized protein PAC_10955 [Phialocephala subalpina]|uniref:Uncharacterized protein n=1 Tax=Phialocephala subalpina TaxID=576137 RepID=A0A1L7X7Q9_9HELO|nr:uncharacterized protein PAC_10955 [Phialocephala subalpina]
MVSNMRSQGGPISQDRPPALPVGWQAKWICEENDFVFIHIATGYSQRENPHQVRPTIPSLQEAAARNARTIVGHDVTIERASLVQDEDVSTQQHMLVPSTCFARLATDLLADVHSSKPEPGPVRPSPFDMWRDVREWYDTQAWEQREALLNSRPLHQAMDNFLDQWDGRRYATPRRSGANLSDIMRTWFEAETSEHQTRIGQQLDGLLFFDPPIHQFINGGPESWARQRYAAPQKSRANQLADASSDILQGQNALIQNKWRNPILVMQVQVSSGQGLFAQQSTLPSQQGPSGSATVSSQTEQSNIDVEASRNDGPQETSSDPSSLRQQTKNDAVTAGVNHTRRAQEVTSTLNDMLNGLQERQPNSPAEQNYSFLATQPALASTISLLDQYAGNANATTLTSDQEKQNTATTKTGHMTSSEPNLNFDLSMIRNTPSRPQTALLSSPFNPPPRHSPTSWLSENPLSPGTPHRTDTAQRQLPRSILSPYLRGQNTSHSRNQSHTQYGPHRPNYDAEAEARSQAGQTMMVNGQEHICGTQWNGLTTAPKRPEINTARPTSQGRGYYQSQQYHQSSTTTGGDMRASSSSNPVTQQQEISSSQPTTAQNDQNEQADTTIGGDMGASSTSNPVVEQQGTNSRAATTQNDQNNQAAANMEGSTREFLPTNLVVRLPPASNSQSASSHTLTHSTLAGMRTSTPLAPMFNQHLLQPETTSRSTPTCSNPSIPAHSIPSWAQMVSQQPPQQVQDQMRVQQHMEARRQGQQGHTQPQALGRGQPTGRGQGVPGAPRGPRYPGPPPPFHVYRGRGGGGHMYRGGRGGGSYRGRGR